ncbi:MAG: rhamnogalacturonan acetylesterase [Kiritimatiellae bacterium]|nr:rhamnogalacturonan acetylesterase [Kiritimatiellia bacterium]
MKNAFERITLAIGIAVSAPAFCEDAAAFRTCTFEQPMEIGNYDVEIDLKPGVNFVKFMGRRLAIDRTEVKAGEKKTVSFTARVPGPYTTKKGDERRNRSLKIELFSDSSRDGDAAFSPRVTPNQSAPTIYICGDSTVTDHRNEPLASWGQILPAFVRRGWTTANFAESGRSMKTFEEEGRLERVLEHLGKDDWVMIQFGHNDQKIKGEEAENGYTRRLGEWIDRIRGKGAHPVVVTPVERRGFHPANGRQWGKTLAKYAEAAKVVAGAKGVPCIDLNDASYRMMGVLGAEGSKKLQRISDDGKVDNTHHGVYGAYEMARIIASGLSKIPVARDAIREPYRAFDPEKPDPESAVAIPPSGSYSNRKPAGS